MKVVLIPASAEPVGVAVHTRSLARLLHMNGIEVSVVVPQPGWLVAELETLSIPSVYLKLRTTPTGLLWNNLRLLRFLARQHRDAVIHLHGRLPTVSCMAPMFLLRRKWVTTVHAFPNTASGPSEKLKAGLEEFLLKRLVHQIVCVSSDLATDVANRLGPLVADRIKVIPNWIDSAEVGPEEDRSEGPPRVVMVGRLAPEKGADLLVEAVQIASRKLEFCCDIIGTGPQEVALRGRIESDQLSRIRLLGQIPDAAAQLGRYDVLVVPSRRESFGIVVLEGYRAGTAVLATDVPGLREIVQSEETGLLVSPDASSLAAGLVRLLGSLRLRKRLVEGGRGLLQDFLPSREKFESFRRVYSGSARSPRRT